MRPEFSTCREQRDEPLNGAKKLAEDRSRIGWQSDRLGAWVCIRSGIAPADLSLDMDGKIPYLKVEDLNASEKYIHSSRAFTNDQHRTLVPSMSVIFPKRGAAISTNKVRINLVDCYIDSNLMALAVKPGLQAEFLYYFLLHKCLYKIADTSSIPQINNKHIEPYPICFPPEKEQKLIIRLLNTWDIAIGKIEQLIAAKLRAKDAYENYFLATKHPDFRRADKLFTPVSEKGRDDLQILSVTQDQGVIPRGMLDKQILMETSSISAFKVVREGDFVISLRSFQGGLEFSPYEGVVSPAYTVLRPQEEVDPGFFRHYLKSKDFIKRLSVAVIGIRDGKQINFSDFASITLPVPPSEVQLQYAIFFDAMEREVILLKKQKKELQKQKRGLMQKLLSGQIRVHSFEEAEAA